MVSYRSLGSVKAVTKTDGTLAWKADYLPFGQQFGTSKLDPTFEEDDLGFTGKGFDADIGLYYFNARWYDADTGRFMSEDPMWDPNNPNLYTYCANNPVNVILKNYYWITTVSGEKAEAALNISMMKEGAWSGADQTYIKVNLSKYIK